MYRPVDILFFLWAAVICQFLAQILSAWFLFLRAIYNLLETELSLLKLFDH